MINASAYLATICIGTLAAVVLFGLRLRQARQGLSVLFAAVPLMLIFGYLLAKGTFLAVFPFYLSGYGAKALISLNPPEFSFVAGCIGACAGVALAAKLFRIRPGIMLDAFAPAGALLVLVFRLGEHFLGYIGYATESWIPPIYQLSSAAALLSLIYAMLSVRKKAPGQLFENTATILCAVQIVLELARASSLIISFVRVDQVLCALVLLGFIVRHACISEVRSPLKRWLPVVLYFALVGINAFIQFFRDRPELMLNRIPHTEAFALWLNSALTPLCYTVLVLVSVLMVLVQRRAARMAGEQ